MVTIDRSYRDSEYYTKWYKQGIVPADNLFMGYQFITGAVNVVGSIFSAVKSSDDDGGGGGSLKGTSKNTASQEEFEEKSAITGKVKKFINACKALKGGKPSAELLAMAKELKKQPLDKYFKKDKVKVINSEIEKVLAYKDGDSSINTSGNNRFEFSFG